MYFVPKGESTLISTTPITSLDIPELKPYRTLRQSEEHFREGIFVAEGEKVVRRLTESRLTILSFLVTPEWLEVYRAMLERREERISVYVADKRLLETIVGYRLHQGIMAVGKIPAKVTLDDVLRNSPRPYLFAAVDGLTNSENLGVLVRNCAAFGVQAILVGETSSSPYLRRAVRNSMGTVFTLRVIHTDHLAETLAELRERHGISVYGTSPTGRQNAADVDLTGSCCFVFGNEGSGISKEVLNACGQTVAIPMRDGIDSLNVGSASAVFLYEVSRQRLSPRP